jgi:GNAT superfamily N-acetyltransferase
MPAAHVVDLSVVMPAEWEGLWQREAQFWRERLFWDISDSLARLRRAVEHRVLSGKALQAGTQSIGYAHYVISGHLGVIPSVVTSPECDDEGVALLIQEIVGTLRRAGASRIESPFISTDISRFCPFFEQEGFRTYWREFLRIRLHRTAPATPSSSSSRAAPGFSPTNVKLEAWRGSDLREAAQIMWSAYEGGIDAEMNEHYRSQDGCELVLDDVLHQGGCGMPVPEASAIARHRGQITGLSILTEVAPRQGHLAHVAVAPKYQRQGIGRLLLMHGLSELADRDFETVSLIVSRLNVRALSIYKMMGFDPVLSFPTFVWQASE